jgi:hypothetical protein
MIEAAATSSLAGIIGAGAGIVTALAVLVGSIAVLIPQLRSVRQVQGEQTKTLNTIHALVNSTLSRSIQEALEATQREIAMMNEVVDLRMRSGLAITPETTAALMRARERVKELASELHDRQKQAEAINAYKAEIAVSKAS